MSARLHHKRITRTEGFSLIEVALALVVLGILIGPVLHLYTIHAAQKPWSDSTGNANLVMSAIGNYYINNQHYPCPADRTLVQGNPNYGMEDRNPGTGRCSIALAPAGTCNPATRECNANNGYDTDNNAVSDNVLIGAVPVASLGLTAKDGIDGYGNELTYMVTELLTDSATFNIARGAIIVRNIDYDANGNAVTDPDPDGDGFPQFLNDIDGGDTIRQPDPPDPQRGAHYVVLSHGVDGNGAFSANGDVASACGPLANARDNENCNNDAIVTFDGGANRDYSTGAGARHFDDYVLYATSAGSGYWSIRPNTVTANAIDVVNTNQQNIGINNSSPTEPLDVKGNIRVQGNAQAVSICDSTGANCFGPEIIGAADSTLLCPDGQAMVGIADAQAVCSNLVVTTPLPPNQSCLTSPLGPFAVGLDASGNVICGP